MARKRANLKKGISGPRKMRSGSFIEPDKELKFGGVSKYTQGGNPKYRNANQESNEKLFNKYLTDAEKSGMSTAEKLKLARQRMQARGDDGSGYTRGGIGTPKATFNGRPGERATTGKGKFDNVKTLLGVLEGVTPKKPTSKPSPNKSSNSSSSKSSNTPPAGKRPAPLTAAPKGRQAGPIATSKPSAELQPSRRTVPSSSKSMSKGKDFSKGKSASTSKAPAQGKDYSKSPSTSKGAGQMIDRRTSAERRKDKRSDRRDNRKARRAAVREARQSYKR